MMSKSRAAAPRVPGKSAGDSGVKIPELAEFLEKRDYVGATTLLEHKCQSNPGDVTNLEWLAYSHFHGGDPQRALDTYIELLRASDDPDPTYHVFAAACLFYLGRYEEAEEKAARGPNTKLQTRILFHCAHKRNDETKLMHYHQQLSDSIEDQLSLASIHYLRGHFQEATDIYKRLLLENKDHLALNVYVALCYCKLDYFDVSLEILAVYLAAHPDSALAVNLKACNQFRLKDGRLQRLSFERCRITRGRVGPIWTMTCFDTIKLCFVGEKAPFRCSHRSLESPRRQGSTL